MLFVFFVAGLSKSGEPIIKFQLKTIRNLRILILCFFSIALTVALNAWNYAQSCRRWNAALADFASDPEKALSTLNRLSPDLNNNPVFLTTYGKALSFGGHHPEAIAILEKALKRQPLSTSYIEYGKSYEAAGFHEKALAAWNRANRMVPSRFKPLYLTMKLHFKNKEYGKAKEYARGLLTKKIKIDNPEIDAMKREAKNILNSRPPPE